MAKTCERCGEPDTYLDEQGRERVSDLTDYCAVCSKDLCAKCMAKGCCGNVPAKSGEKADEAADVEQVQKAWKKARAKKKK